MKFNSLKEYDLSLHLISSRVDIDGYEIQGLSSLSKVRDNYICFLKNRRFLNRLIGFLDSAKVKSVGLVLAKSLWSELDGEEEIVSRLESHSSFISVVDDVDMAISYLSGPFYKESVSKFDLFSDGRTKGTAVIHPEAQITEGVFIGDGVEIGAGVQIFAGVVVMAASKIAEGTTIYPNVTIYENVKIGKNCRIHAGTVIGADGFGYNFKNGVHHKVWHIGAVTIGDNVEIGAGSAVDRGTFDDTTIGNGTKIDNQVQVAHNCKVGNGVILCGQTALAGSGTVGDFCVFGGRAGLGPDITMGMGCQVAAGAMINNDWPAGSQVAGHPARPVKEWLRGLAFVRKNSVIKK